MILGHEHRDQLTAPVVKRDQADAVEIDDIGVR